MKYIRKNRFIYNAKGRTFVSERRPLEFVEWYNKIHEKKISLNKVNWDLVKQNMSYHYGMNYVFE